MNLDRLLTDRVRSIDASGVRRVFELGAQMANPINLSIGQPDFPVPDPIKHAATRAIEADHNGYSLTQGIAPLRSRIAEHLAHDIGWRVASGPESPADAPGLVITSGTSGALLTAFMALIGPGDEAIIPDPYFVMYPALATMCGGNAVRCDTAPDFRMTAERVEPLITDRTKLVLLNSPGNPTGVVLSEQECRDLHDLCKDRGIILISDEIYDEFTFSEARTQPTTSDANDRRCPSPCRFPGSEEHTLLIRGFGKTYGVTGWRLGYAAGPAKLLAEMAKLQQYTFVCAPAPLQHGVMASFDVDLSPIVAEYETRRDMITDRLSKVTELAAPSGAFYAYPRVPEHLGIGGKAFFERCVERELLVIPGSVFSSHDTHIRLSFAAPRDKLDRGLDILVDLMQT